MDDSSIYVQLGCYFFSSYIQLDNNNISLLLYMVKFFCFTSLWIYFTKCSNSFWISPRGRICIRLLWPISHYCATCGKIFTFGGKFKEHLVFDTLLSAENNIVYSTISTALYFWHNLKLFEFFEISKTKFELPFFQMQIV